jgi:hypothetical protein
MYIICTNDSSAPDMFPPRKDKVWKLLETLKMVNGSMPLVRLIEFNVDLVKRVLLFNMFAIDKELQTNLLSDMVDRLFG